MTKKKSPNQGRVFEKNIEDSLKESKQWFFRVRDVNPGALKGGVFNIPRNPYDLLIFDSNILFTLELKSTQDKSITHRGSNPQIKEHQVEALSKASEFENVISGFILNYRGEEKTYFIFIEDYLDYLAVTKGKKEDAYKAKINEKSIPLRICKEVGIEVLSIKKRVHHRYFINDLLDQVVYEYNKRQFIKK